MKAFIVSCYGLLKGEVTDFNGFVDEYGDPVPYAISEGLITGCALCNQKDDLKKCSGCQAINYCSREHQLADRSKHKFFCNMVKKGRDYVKREEAKLNSHPGNDLMERDPFKNHVGHFWWVRPTRNYIRSRFSVVDGLLRINTELAVKQSLDDILDMLRLSRTDNIGARLFVPALYIRLGRDQEAYDFLKWHITTGCDDNYDWRDMKLGFLDVQDADIFEPVYIFMKDYSLPLCHLVSLMLLKIRLVVDLLSLDTSNRQARALFSEEVMKEIQNREPTTRFKDKTAVFKKDLSAHIRNLKQQIKLLYNTVKCANYFMWPSMLNPGDDLTARPHNYCQGERTEMQMSLHANYNAYKETCGALDVIEKLSN